MNRIKQYSFIIGFITIFFAACGQKEYITSETGLEYLKVKEGSGERPNDGEFLMLNVSYSDANDNVMFSSAERGGALPLNYVDSVFKNNGSLEEGFKLCGKGDSLILRVPAEIIFKESFRRPLPDTIPPESIITVNLGVQDIFTQEEFQTYRAEQSRKAREKAAGETKEQVAKDARIIEDYLIEEGIEAQSTPEGLYYVITKNGNGEQPENGNTVVVNYTGKLLDGTMFDSSVEEDAKAGGVYTEGRNYGAPFEFPLGQGRVIKGWDIGIALLSKGAKATLYIPSGLAYGPGARGEVIGSNAVLMFDVELVDFK
ncbi:MAG: FKBP-type peptidyl-prolyl cis-trans isomerase [Cyclobacteriaceae bacterium]|nr:FKBP-type peptidyl-prolyl cis-trans isomerase [Cyclobacteriaceae bacterium]